MIFLKNPVNFWTECKAQQDKYITHNILLFMNSINPKEILFLLLTSQTPSPIPPLVVPPGG